MKTMKTRHYFIDLTQRPPRSFRVRLGNYVVLARMLDKGRATLAKKNGEYHYDCATDQRLAGRRSEGHLHACGCLRQRDSCPGFIRLHFNKRSGNFSRHVPLPPASGRCPGTGWPSNSNRSLIAIVTDFTATIIAQSQ